MNAANKLTSLVCVAFVVAIALPMVVSIAQTDKEISSSEKRRLQAWPIFAEAESLRSYFSTINTYINDHFGFREDLIELNNKIKYSLNESPVKTVVLGNDEWLFNKYIDPLMSNHVDSDETLKGSLIARAEYIKRRHRELEQQGIVYQHIVVPNKMSLYPEHLPKLYALTDVNATYNFFKEQLLDTGGAIAYDAIDTLTLNKNNEFGFDLYYKKDTHWNPVGAYIVYQESLRRLKNEHPELALDIKDHTFEAHTKSSGDLARYIGLSSILEAQEPLTVFPKCTARSNIKLIKENFSVSSCSANDTKMLLVADSFMTGIYPFMSESVGSLYMTSQKISRSDLRQRINDLRPDVVVEVLVERSLARPLP